MGYLVLAFIKGEARIPVTPVTSTRAGEHRDDGMPSFLCLSQIAVFGRIRVSKIVAAMATGGLIGSLFLLVSSNVAFSGCHSAPLESATLSFALGARIQEWARQHSFGKSRTFQHLLVSICGGCFNGGPSIVLPALFSP